MSRIILHPQYVPGDQYNDVALLLLADEAVLGSTVGTICLPPQSQSFDGAQCFSSGWGKDIFGNRGRYQQVGFQGLGEIFCARQESFFYWIIGGYVARGF